MFEWQSNVHGCASSLLNGDNVVMTDLQLDALQCTMSASSQTGRRR